MNLTRLFYGIGVAALVASSLLVGGPANAQESCTKGKATAVALARYPAARVLEVDRDRTNGIRVYDVELRLSNGSVIEVMVNASTCEFVGIEADDADPGGDVEDDNDDGEEEEGALRAETSVGDEVGQAEEIPGEGQ